MAEQWIAAATARDLVASVSALSSSGRALCSRANAGAVATKAKLLIFGDRRAEGALIPAAFWWAKGEAALSQNWGTGDFSTWIDQTIECRAFGVTFALSGVLDMLPAERHADATRRLSVAGQPEWVSVAEAVQLASRLPSVTNGRHYVVEQARLGLLQGQAVLAERFTRRDCATLTWAEREWPISTFVWEAIIKAGDAYQQWDLGQLNAGLSVGGTPEWLRLSGVHILAEPLRRGSSVPSSSTPAPTPKTNVGGRPAQAWWDDMWCAVWGLIHQGDFQPKSQAEVEKAMLTWATMNEHEVSEAAVRPKARKLFETYKGEARNFLAT